MRNPRRDADDGWPVYVIATDGEEATDTRGFSRNRNRLLAPCHCGARENQEADPAIHYLLCWSALPWNVLPMIMSPKRILSFRLCCEPADLLWTNSCPKVKLLRLFLAGKIGSNAAHTASGVNRTRGIPIQRKRDDSLPCGRVDIARHPNDMHLAIRVMDNKPGLARNFDHVIEIEVRNVVERGEEWKRHVARILLVMTTSSPWRFVKSARAKGPRLYLKRLWLS